MIELTHCPVCQKSHSVVLGSYQGRSTIPPTSIHEAGTNALLKHVLQADSYCSNTMRCRCCGHVYLTPTFSESELNRFYSEETAVEMKREYRSWEFTTGESWSDLHNVPQGCEVRLDELATKVRSRSLFNMIARFAARSALPANILDVGGRSGRLTEEFRIARRFVYDKVTSAVSSEVIALSTMEQVRQQAPFDLIVLSHVLEHVPQPMDFLAGFMEFLSPRGLVYVEVPLEYCGSVVKRKAIPLTGHVNYFTPCSVRHMMLRCGLGKVLRLERTAGWYGEQRMVVIKVLARAGEPELRKSSSARLSVDLFLDCALTFWTRKFTKCEIAKLLSQSDG